jgi:hypothetical protein
MSFCEVENKHECLQTVQLFVTAILEEIYRTAAFSFFAEVPDMSYRS